MSSSSSQRSSQHRPRQQRGDSSDDSFGSLGRPSPDSQSSAVISLLSHSRTLKVPYGEQKRMLAQALLADSHFADSGELLQTMEKGGIYEEIRQHLPYGRSPYARPDERRTAYIVAGFKVLEATFRDVMENNWKDWTGARSIYINLALEFGLHRFSLYRRSQPSTVRPAHVVIDRSCGIIGGPVHVVLHGRKCLFLCAQKRVQQNIGV
ncbi:hypothetical protein V5799_000956 [Amblyomma americanum]|uniref:DUF7153 domain-containing protein n=1 Tax=Amblyomma americanum TaxID=6943 RepID=A0AAQ4D1J9_AMBAM